MMTTIQLMHNKKTMRFDVVQMTIYKQTKIVEAIGQKNQSYYLFFYKDRYINAKKTTSIRLQSFLKNALQYGYTFTADHPLTKALLTEEKAYRLTSNNQMVQKLSNKYNETEMLYVLAMFDNYVNEKKIQALCKKTFYNYRRNGQLKKAFRILANYAQVRPQDMFAKDMLQHFDFQKYKDQYQDIEQLTIEWSDPLYLESVYFEQKFPDTVINFVIQQYHKDNRKFDQLFLIYMKCSSLEVVSKLDELCQELLSEQDQIALWEDLLASYPAPKTIIEKLVKLNGYQAILKYYLHHHEAIEDRELFEKSLESVSTDQLIEDYQPLLQALMLTYKDDTAQLERVLHLTIKKLLQYLPLKDIITSLKDTELPIMQKLRKMDKLTDNPDQQFALGEIYYDLEQYDQAIACFEWEMELAPEDPAPIQYLYKSYLAKGDKEQANTYKQLMVNIPS
ncbi:tetratricopeptide repeat protein [Gracilibacillus sp. D59]|uniref:tetratricopeptide repeat protein n=1 Tax=Gracilibacillus sp. D59 TaxID=3457434 RepID=UPI003FCE53F9